MWGFSGREFGNDARCNLETQLTPGQCRNLSAVHRICIFYNSSTLNPKSQISRTRGLMEAEDFLFGASMGPSLLFGRSRFPCFLFI